jgi:hypothetical integral membrane protein (TIGR02206 family)
LAELSTAHLAALGVLVVAVSASVWLARRHPGRWEVPAARALALIVFAAWAGEYLADALDGIWTVGNTLPLQLTDAISLATVAALWTRRAVFVELVYFWALTASLQATLTPDLGYTFPNLFYFTFFTYHLGAIIAACYLVFGTGQAPRPGALWRVYAATWAWAAIAGLGDLATGGNYMFLRAKPAQASLLSLLGPWPVYIVLASLVALALFSLLDWLARSGRPRARLSRDNR